MNVHSLMVREEEVVDEVERGTEMSGLDRTVNCEADSELVNVREDSVREPEGMEKREHVNEGEEVEEEEGS